MIDEKFVEATLKFYKNSGWKPMSHSYIDEENHRCCPIGGAVLDKDPLVNEESICAIEASKKLGFSEAFIYGITKGFDGCLPDCGEHDKDDFFNGYDTGKYLRTKLSKEIVKRVY